MPAPSVGLCWPGLTFDRARVLSLGFPAYTWTPEGELWEFEDGAFFVTGLHDRGRRRPVEEPALAPLEGWSHPPECGCPACRVERF